MFLNSLCSDPDCLANRGCQHLGPKGQHCFFEVEKELCEVLNIPWNQGISLKYLLAEVRFRLTGKETLPDELPIALKSTDELVSELTDKLKVVR